MSSPLSQLLLFAMLTMQLGCMIVSLILFALTLCGVSKLTKSPRTSH